MYSIHINTYSTYIRGQTYKPCMQYTDVTPYDFLRLDQCKKVFRCMGQLLSLLDTSEDITCIDALTKSTVQKALS